MVDEIKVEGLTARELKTALEKAYREILLDPEITVNVIEFVAPHVFVGGQVAKPGSYDLRILYDANKNGIWDGGSFGKIKKQPEIVRLIPKVFTVKGNWDNEVTIVL